MSWTLAVPQLSTGNVILREVVSSDAPTLFELLSDPPVSEYLAAPPPSVEAFAGFIAWAQSERAAGNSVCFGIVPRGFHAAVGIIQLRALEPSWFTAEWGFAIGAAFWATGMFIEAARLVAGFAFTTLNVHRIEARAVTNNARALGALQKLGAQPEGTLAKAFRKDGRKRPQLLWTLRADVFQTVSQVQPRLSAEEAEAKILQAIADTEQRRVDPQPTGPMGADDAAAMYPFFITDKTSKKS